MSVSPASQQNLTDFDDDPSDVYISDEIHHSDDRIRPVKGCPLVAVATCSKASTMKTPAEQMTPTSYKRALEHQHSQKWKDAMAREVDQQNSTNTYSLIRRSDIPHGHRVIPGHWVFKAKQIDDIPIEQDYKARARWAIQGNKMEKDFMKSYAPVVNEATTKLLLALSTLNEWHVRKGDVAAAFLNGNIKDSDPNKRIFMTQPLGHEEGEKGQFVCELHQALYGLIPAARIWYDTLTKKMKELDFRVSPYDAGLWIHRYRQLYVTTHVDDFQTYAPKEADIDWFMATLNQSFEFNDVGDAQKYLGVDVRRNSEADTTMLSQKEYAEELITTFGLADAHPVKLPMDPGLIIDDAPDSTVDQKEYQRAIGCLIWLTTKTRPDMARATGVLSQYTIRPTKKCWLST